MKRANITRILAVVLLVLSSIALSAKGKEPIKILAIGNSFSHDAVEQNLHEIGEAAGVSMIIGNMYIGGCSIDRHVSCLVNNLNDYSYRKVDLYGNRTENPGWTLAQAIVDEKWDYVSLQQCSPDSGKPETYAQIGILIDWIHEFAPQAKIIFHQTWAYAKNSPHQSFVNYDHDQMTMYNAIMKTVKQIDKQYKFAKVVPCGTAVQNARTTVLGDDLTRDGHHLDHRVGRYIAAATWFETITGKSVVGNIYCPANVSPLEVRVAQRAAHSACRHPYKVSKQH